VEIVEENEWITPEFSTVVPCRFFGLSLFRKI